MTVAPIARTGACLLPALLAACASARPPAPARAPAAGPPVDADGVQRLHPSAPGLDFHLGARPTEGFEIERGTPALPAREGPLAFWTVAAHPLDYSSGGTGLTIRLHVRSGPEPQRFTWRTQQGYLSTARDLRNQEVTAYVRVHGITDERRAAVSIKIRGGAHSPRDGDLASCVMMTFQAATTGAAARFGKELHHPDYDYVRLPPRLPLALTDGRWVGLKVVSYADPHPDGPARVVNRLYVDGEPWDARGRPRNDWRLFSEYVDEAGASTGRYDTLVDWGGWVTTVRTDGVASLDFAILSAREIAPPR
jgi:hypothetical protein